MTRRLVAGDAGGTKTLLRCVEDDRLVREERFDSTAYPTFDALLRDFLAEIQGPVDAACFAVAGPVYAARTEITNVGWVLEERALETTFSIPRVTLINDFYAVALGVPLLTESDVLPVHTGKRDRTAPMAILGAGTGLGEAIVTFSGNHHHVIASEGGHQDFAPQDEEQARLFLHLRKIHGHVSWERLVSGMGLVNIFTFLGGEEKEPAEIADLAAKGDPRAVHTMEMFVDMYGAEAGNMALRVLARGGVFLAGGIAAKNLEWFTDGRFIEAFLRKGRFRSLMDTIPVDLIVNEAVGVMGAVECARRTVVEHGARNTEHGTKNEA